MQLIHELDTTKYSLAAFPRDKRIIKRHDLRLLLHRRVWINLVQRCLTLVYHHVVQLIHPAVWLVGAARQLSEAAPRKASIGMTIRDLGHEHTVKVVLLALVPDNRQSFVGWAYKFACLDAI